MIEGFNEHTPMTAREAIEHGEVIIGMAAPMVLIVKRIAEEFDIPFSDALAVYRWTESISDVTQKMQVLESIGETMEKLLRQEPGDDEPWKDSL